MSDHHESPSIEQKIQIVQIFILRRKGIKINIVLNENNKLKELRLLEMAFKIAVMNSI